MHSIHISSMTSNSFPFRTRDHAPRKSSYALTPSPSEDRTSPFLRSSKVTTEIGCTRLWAREPGDCCDGTCSIELRRQNDLPVSSLTYCPHVIKTLAFGNY